MPPLRLVFLDIDGVLNSYPFLERHDAADPDEADDRYWTSMLDPAAVARLNRLLDATGARVVIASSWRCAMPLERLRQILLAAGLEGVIEGQTAPELNHRGRAVSAYLAERPCRDYVILDDDPFQKPHTGRLVHTDPELGLTEAQVDEAIELVCGTSSEAG